MRNFIFIIFCAAVTALFLTSCATENKMPSSDASASVEQTPAAAVNRQTKAGNERKKPKNPFFKDDDPDSHYENEDEDELPVTYWFRDKLRAFWHAVTFSGRALR